MIVMVPYMATGRTTQRPFISANSPLSTEPRTPGATIYTVDIVDKGTTVLLIQLDACWPMIRDGHLLYAGTSAAVDRRTARSTAIYQRESMPGCYFGLMRQTASESTAGFYLCTAGGVQDGVNVTGFELSVRCPVTHHGRICCSHTMAAFSVMIALGCIYHWRVGLMKLAWPRHGRTVGGHTAAVPSINAATLA